MQTADTRNPNRSHTLGHLRRRLATGAAFACALAAPALIAGITSPASAQSATADAAPYKSDAALPAKFLTVLNSDSGTDPRMMTNGKKLVGYNKTETTLTVDGQPQRVIVQTIAWDNDAISNGVFAYSSPNGIAAEGFTGLGGGTDADWIAFKPKLIEQADKNGAWSYVTLRYLPAMAGGAAKLVVPVPDLQLNAAKKEVADGLASFRQTMTTLSASTTSGQYFPAAQIPANLDAVRNAMLVYGNRARLIPGFRKAVGAKTATEIDLSRQPLVTSVKTLDHPSEPVHPQPDMILDPEMNKLAQWHAEALASGNGLAHDYTANGGLWTDPTGKTVRMAGLGDRRTYFNVMGHVAEIAASKMNPGDMPYGWMAGDTHYRWHFGVDGTYPKIGYGAARGKDGWHYVGVAVNTTPTPR